MILIGKIFHYHLSKYNLIIQNRTCMENLFSINVNMCKSGQSNLLEVLKFIICQPVMAKNY